VESIFRRNNANSNSLIIRRNITGFFNRNGRDTVPEFSVHDFKRIVYGIHLPHLINILSISERGVTPNFHSALVQCDGKTLSILGHSIYPILAFAEPVMEGHFSLTFVDCEQIARKVTQAFPGVSVVSIFELNQKFTEQDLTPLDEVEREQIRHWKPQTVGEIVFNWWD